MSAELFPTIVGQHWRTMFADVLAGKRKPDSGILAQIRAEVAARFSEPTEVKTKANERRAGACENSGASNFITHSLVLPSRTWCERCEQLCNGDCGSRACPFARVA